jgi:hypothetical protein
MYAIEMGTDVIAYVSRLGEIGSCIEKSIGGIA